LLLRRLLAQLFHWQQTLCILHCAELMSDLSFNLCLCLQHTNAGLLNGMAFLCQFTLLPAPVEYLPREKRSGERDLIRKYLTDVKPLKMRSNEVNISDIVQCLDVFVVLRLLHRQSCSLDGWSACQSLSQHRL